MDAFTPGPWTVGNDKGGDGSFDILSTGKRPYYIADVGAPFEELREANRANARLIAASPDLLLELRLLVEAIEGHSAPEGSAADEPYIASRLSFAHDAIAKATTP
jgi:hypothetical protein